MMSTKSCSLTIGLFSLLLGYCKGGISPSKPYKTKPVVVFEAGWIQNIRANRGVERVYYRIPALLKTTKGTLLAAADANIGHNADWGPSILVVKHSKDKGKTWSDQSIVLQLPSVDGPFGMGQGHQPPYNAAFTIDPALIQSTRTNRIFLFCSMFPQIKGIFGSRPGDESIQYKTINGKKYLTLLDQDDNLYTLREHGEVYDQGGQKTPYTVVVESKSPARNDLGDIYDGNKFAGNIYLYDVYKGHTAPLTVPKVGYIWMFYSDDDGLTWSQPVDITPQVKERWMFFLGVSPGAGITTTNGRLVVPVYTAMAQYGEFSPNTQSSSVIYSDDDGLTW